jgi:hypothetical protein
MKKARLPSTASNVWPGGFVFDENRHVAHVAGGGGSVATAPGARSPFGAGAPS